MYCEDLASRCATLEGSNTEVGGEKWRRKKQKSQL